MFFSFGLWNVLLLPFTISTSRRDRVPVRAPGGPDLGRLRGRVVLHGPLLREAARAGLDHRGDDRDGDLRRAVRPSRPRSTSRSCWSCSPASSTRRRRSPRSVLLQRNTPREMRGRVFSAFYVMRDVIFLFGMAAAGLADYVDIRVLIIVASSLLFVSAAFTLVAPGLGFSTWGAAADRLRGATAPVLATSPVRAATLADFDRLAGRLGAFCAADARAAFGIRLEGDGRARSRAGRASSSTAMRPRRRTSSSTDRRRRASRSTTASAACRPWPPATSSARSRR